MYGNVGLPTAKGSGTSGYVQKSLAFIGWKKYDSNNYKEVLQKFRDNPAPLKRKANQDILNHEKLHKIESQLFDYAEELKNQNFDEKDIQEKIDLKRKELLNQYENNSNQCNINDQETHQQSKLKELQIDKFKNAIGVRNEYVPGSAFDFELQQEQREIRNLEKKKNKKIKEKEHHKKKHKHRKEIEKEKNIEKNDRNSINSKSNDTQKNKKENNAENRNDNKNDNKIIKKHKNNYKNRSRSRSKSRSKSRSYSRSFSRSHSRSYSRNFSRSRSRNYSKDSKSSK